MLQIHPIAKSLHITHSRNEMPETTDKVFLSRVQFPRRLNAIRFLFQLLPTSTVITSLSVQSDARSVDVAAERREIYSISHTNTEGRKRSR